jgi:hypothetical protein
VQSTVLFFGEQVCGDLIGVVQAQQLATLSGLPHD